MATAHSTHDYQQILLHDCKTEKNTSLNFSDESGDGSTEGWRFYHLFAGLF